MPKCTTLVLTWIATIGGILDAGYLSYVHLTQVPIYCTPGLGHCETVNSSPYALLYGIPVAYLGLLSYLAILFLLFFGEKIKFLKPYALYLVFGLSAFGFLFSLYLTYLEIWVIKAICQWCVTSAILMTVILICATIRVFNRQES